MSLRLGLRDGLRQRGESDPRAGSDWIGFPDGFPALPRWATLFRPWRDWLAWSA